MLFNRRKEKIIKKKEAIINELNISLSPVFNTICIHNDVIFVPKRLKLNKSNSIVLEIGTGDELDGFIVNRNVDTLISVLGVDGFIDRVLSHRKNWLNLKDKLDKLGFKITEK